MLPPCRPEVVPVRRSASLPFAVDPECSNSQSGTLRCGIIARVIGARIAAFQESVFICLFLTGRDFLDQGNSGLCGLTSHAHGWPLIRSPQVCFSPSCERAISDRSAVVFR